jgi:hypothetical protein
MSIHRELLEFSKTRPVWQQDLIRRICTQPDISDDDLDQVLWNLKASHGLLDACPLSPVEEAHLSQRGTGDAPSVTLAAISDVQNANQLAANQLLPFALQGITLIYGDNGSGKTGYTRIVKQICRARRDRDEPVLGNVYKSSAGPAKAAITYILEGERREFRWEDGKSSPPDLSRISVFDASCASLYADHQNRIEFLPLGLDVMPRLGAACERLANRLQSEINVLASSISVPLPQQVSQSFAEALTGRFGSWYATNRSPPGSRNTRGCDLVWAPPGTATRSRKGATKALRACASCGSMQKI